LRPALVAVLVCLGCSNNGSGVGGEGGGFSARGGGDGGGAGVGGGGIIGHGGDGGGGPVGPGGSPEAFCLSYKDAFCSREQRCGYLSSFGFGDCLNQVFARCNERAKRFAEGVRRFDAKEAIDCVAAIQAEACVAPQMLAANGEPLLYDCFRDLGEAGAITGAACETSDDCVSGTCAGSALSCRSCVAFAKVGEACGAAVCDPSVAYCGAAGLCIAYRAPWTSCADGTLCNPAISRSCSPIMPDGGDPLCFGLGATGDACDAGDACRDKLCNSQGLCGALLFNAACATPEDCGASGFCSGLCRPRVGINQPCAVTLADPNDGCALGTFCFDGFCKPPGSQVAGQDCGRSADCQSALRCAFATDGSRYGRCDARLDAGQPCTEDHSCALGSVCRNGTCFTLRDVGSLCSTSADCLEARSCSTPDGGGHYCVPWAHESQACGPGSVCFTFAGGGYCSPRDAGQSFCMAPRPVAATATSDDQCSSQRCITADGGPCSSSEPGACAAACLP
jgi:hypothetical protein